MNNYYVYFTLTTDSIGGEIELEAPSIEEAVLLIKSHKEWFKFGKHNINMNQVVRFYVEHPSNSAGAVFF
jgi:hypothetical protein